MLYNKKLKCGLRKKSLPEPNPTKVELPQSTTFFELQAKAKSLFFQDYNGIMLLGDSQGTVIHISDPQQWTLGSFYQRNQFQPSKHKLYIIMDAEVCEC